MKAFTLSLFLTLASFAARADIPLQDTQCGTGLTAFCSSPAPGVSLLTFSPSGGRLTVTINGVQYVSAPYSATAQGGTVYASDGTWKEVSTVFVSWRTRTVTGIYITHWELKSGTIT